MRRLLLWACSAVLLLSLLTAPFGYWWMPAELHPWRRALAPEMITQADAVFHQAGAQREDFNVRALDGVLLRGWIVRPTAPLAPNSTRDWVLLFHGVGDNRTGVMGQAEFLLRAGYGVVMMDSRAQGESDGAIATYGWKERDDVRAVVANLEEKVRVGCVFELGVSMGASIALQAAAVEPRVAGVVAESPFSDIREAAYDYAGFHYSPLLGRTFFRPAVEAGLYAAGRDGGISISEVSPVHAVRNRNFPILLIAAGLDTTLPLRHAQLIYDSATGPRQLWVVPNAAHASAFGTAQEEYQRRVLEFFSGIKPARGGSND
ncbi:MAG TPA: alpha/beta fold hydrolase [Candidatus Acidoferrales bacterium]|nr:alpha/beta fold hydrolase [Candidatus Acidoferrales bacterium]